MIVIYKYVRGYQLHEETSVEVKKYIWLIILKVILAEFSWNFLKVGVIQQ